MKKYFLFADGASPHTLKWAKELKKYYDLYLISFNAISEEIKQEIASEKISVFNNYKILGKIRIFIYILKIRKILRAKKADFVNAHYISSYGLISGLTKNKTATFIASAWGSDVLIFPKKSIIHKMLLKFVLRKADFITADSKDAANSMIELDLLCEPKLSVFSFFDMNVFLQKLIPTSKEKIVYSNRALSKNYNIDQIITWFAKQDASYKLIIANTGEASDMLMDLVLELNLNKRVEFVGLLDEYKQKEIYSKSMYYISIPSSDATAVSLLEAMSAKSIPIVSNLPSNKEWIVDGVNGYIFSSDFKLPIQYEVNVAQQAYQTICNSIPFSQSIYELVKRLV